MCEEEEETLKIEEKKDHKDDGFIEIKKRKRNQKIEEKHDLHEKEKKIYICKSLRNGTPCTFSDKCNYAHSSKELEPQQCSFGEKCGRVKINNNIVKNVDSNNPCAYLHGSETVKNYLIRHKMNEGFQLNKIDNTVEINEFAYTRLCTSIIDNTVCSRGAKCTYAHNPEQLKINPCTYGERCFHVSKIDGEYINNTKSDKTCIFLHPDERLYNYASRVFKIKKKVSPASSGFVTPKAKRTKSDIPPPAPKKEKVIEKPRELDLVPTMIIDDKSITIDDGEKIIISVPSHMALEMLEIILKSGKTNIELKTY
jgi:hypothetical protein